MFQEAVEEPQLIARYYVFICREKLDFGQGPQESYVLQPPPPNHYDLSSF